MGSSSKESRLILALQAIKKDPNLSVRAAAKIYNIPESTLRTRRAGKKSRRDLSANLRKLTDLEESVLKEHIIDLDMRGFPPRLSGVQEMADLLRTARDASRVGPRWAENFVKRHPDITTRFRRPIDYQRAQCEDPDVVRAWFALVRNTIAKYGIQEVDIYNFDETGFLMGMLSSAKVVTISERRGRPRTKQPGNREWVSVIQGIGADGWSLPPFVVVKGQYHLLSWYQDSKFPDTWKIRTSETGWTTNEIGLDWLRHFDTHTKPRTKGLHRLLILDGHGSHHSAEFHEYCKANNIIALCMPPHSSHFLQPLDVGCFSPLKSSYGKAIEEMMRNQITHITKEDFFDAFYGAFMAAMSEKNVRAGFRATGLVPYDPETVISRLDPKPITPSPPNSRPGTATSWVFKTPKTAHDATQQSTAIKRRIANHQNSSPAQLYEVIDLQAKGLSKMAHRLVLVEAELKDIRAHNERLSKRRRAKKTRLQNGESLSIAEASDLIDQIEVGEQVKEETRRGNGRTTRAATGPRRCGNCGKTGHNRRTCQVVWETSDEGDLE